MNPQIETKPKRVALYARASTTDQRPENQVHDLRRLAEQRGWQTQGIYCDHGISGTRDRRPELDKLMAAVHQGEVDVVVVWRFDRFARSVRHLVTALDDFSARGVDFVSMMDGIDTSTAAGRFTFTVIAACSQMEVEILRERTRCGIQAARRRGARIGRPPVHVDLRRARLLQHDGWSIRRIATELKVGASTVHRALAEDVPEPGLPRASQTPVITDTA